jgi:CheY-specific phosphatase CheX
MSWNVSWGWRMRELDLVRHLQPAFTEVLETMFFTSVVDTCPGRGVPAGAPAVSSRLTFRGDPSGVFEIGITQDAARSLAASFLGEEEQELSEGRAGDVVCELANMLCGSVLSRIGGDFTFDLSHPEIVPAALEAPDTSLCFELPEGMLAVSIRFEAPA